MRAEATAASAAMPPHPSWSQLLADAVRTPGIISQAYSRFWNYSMGNQILAMIQCMMRKLEPGPINTFVGWIKVGRHVRKGERALTLCMPITVKRKVGQGKLDLEASRSGDGAERQLTGPGGAVLGPHESAGVTVFTYKARWFVLNQTDGDHYVPQELPEWSESRALHALLIDRIPFDHPSGNCQGFAVDHRVSVSPIALLPHKTLFHELAHVQLGHTQEGNRLDDHDMTPRKLREVEAECVALICCESLKLDGAAECRGYIQRWLHGDAIPERSAQRIFKVADQILRAGRPAVAIDTVTAL